VGTLERREIKERQKSRGLDLGAEALSACAERIAACESAVRQAREALAEAERDARSFGETSRGDEYRGRVKDARSKLSAVTASLDRAKARILDVRVACAVAALGRHALELLDRGDADPKRIAERADSAARDVARSFESVQGAAPPDSFTAPIRDAARDATELFAKVTLVRRRERVREKQITAADDAELEPADPARVEAGLDAFRRRIEESEALLELDEELHVVSMRRR